MGVEFRGQVGEVMGPESAGLLQVPSCCGCLGRSLTYIPAYSRTPGKPSDCLVFRGADMLVICPGRRNKLEGSKGDMRSL